MAEVIPYESISLLGYRDATGHKLTCSWVGYFPIRHFVLVGPATAHMKLRGLEPAPTVWLAESKEDALAMVATMPGSVYGFGWRHGDRYPDECPECHGVGRFQRSELRDGTKLHWSEDCAACGGSGKRV